MERHDSELADQIMELIIYSSMPTDRFFDTVGMSENARETLLSAFYCFMKYRDDFKEAVILAMNARGASRHRTGNRHGIAGVTGFLSGAYNGFVQIPHNWMNGLHEHESVFETATELYSRSFNA